MKMKICTVVLFSVFLLTGGIPVGLTLPATAPAFLWSPHLRFLDAEPETVNYQIIPAKDLVNSILSQGGWSDLLCSRNKVQQPVDVALVFVGKELQSSDLSANRDANPGLIDLLKTSFTQSNFSVAFPYVAASEGERLENLLVSGFKGACGNTLGVGNIVLSESCIVEDNTAKKLTGLHSLHDHLIARKEKRTEGQTDLVILCSGSSHSSKGLAESRAEGEILSEILTSAEQSGARYAALYVSDPYRYSYLELQRFLSEGAAGNESANATTCDEVCKFKASLLEGVLVGIVLLLILISGLCCMAGIDTPAKFETPQDS